MPAAVGLALKRRLCLPLLFDMRAFWPDERVEGGSWNLANPLFRAVYRYFKRLESALLRTSDAIVSLTEAGKAELLRRPELAGRADRVSVIPCCVDFDHFPLATPAIRAAVRSELGISPETSVLAYLGSLGGNYMLGEMLDLFELYARDHPGAVFLFVTQGDADAIRRAASSQGIDAGRLVICAAGRDEVPRLLAAADLGVAFKQPTYSAAECSPTKLGEMLAVGLPVIVNAGVGDVAPIIAETYGGAVVHSFDGESYAGAFRDIGKDCTSPNERRERALRIYDVRSGVAAYDGIYRRLLDQTATA
jgi:glycosyltransferase involved in cell wall biosynthesis